MTLTTEELDKIRERAEKATGGNWSYFIDSNGLRICTPGERAPEILNREADANFAIHAREDGPKLLAEIERLTKRLNESECLLSEAHDLLDDVHCYETDVYNAISKYFNGEEDED